MTALYNNYLGTEEPWVALTLDSANDWGGQSFTTPVGYSLERIDLWLKKDTGDDVGTISVELYADAGDGHPDMVEGVLASGTILNDSISDSAYAWIACTLDSPYVLTAVTKYCIVVHGASLSPTVRVHWSYDDNIVFTGGDIEWSSTGGVSWSTTTNADLLFRCYGDGDLYPVGLYGAGSHGKLVKWNEVDAWVEIAPQADSQIIHSLAILNGKLYGGTHQGKLFEWNGAGAWVEVAPGLVVGIIRDLVVFNDKLYGASDSGALHEWNGTDAWVEVAPALGALNVVSLAVFDSKIYGGVGDTGGGRLFEWNGTDAWVEVAPLLGSATYVNALVVFDGKLYGGMGGNSQALLYEWNGTNAWVEVAPRFQSQIDILSLEVFNDKIYGGTFNLAQLHEWNGVNAWTEAAPRLSSQTHVYSLVTYNDKLYGGTGHASDGGRLLEWDEVSAWVEKAVELGDQNEMYALLSFIIVPVITDQSTDITVGVGEETTLFITDTGDPTPTYQWYKNDVLMSGETSSTLTIFPTSTATYKCTAINDAGEVTSDPIIVTVVRNPYTYNLFSLFLDAERVD